MLSSMIPRVDLGLHEYIHITIFLYWLIVVRYDYDFPLCILDPIVVYILCNLRDKLSIDIKGKVVRVRVEFIE